MPPIPASYIPRRNPDRLLDPYWTGERCTLYQGDCLKILRNLPDASVDLIATDPPFNIGHEYDEYEDWKTTEEYLQWTRQWLAESVRMLRPKGSIWVAIGSRYQAEMKYLMDRAGLHWRDTVIWHYGFGPNQESKLTPSWVAMHYATKNPKNWTWNPDEIRVPSARQLKYKDRRANPQGKVPDNCWILLPDEDLRFGLPEMNLWIESRVCGTFKERTDHPCQMPVALIDRIVRLCSNPGDMIGDWFLGSGTTGEAALRNGRSFVGVELSESYLKHIVVPRLAKYGS